MVHKLQNLIRGIAQMHTAAHADDGAFCPLQLVDDLLDLDRVSRDRGLVSPQVDRLRILEVTDGLLLDIDREVDQDRALAACIGNVEGLLHDPGDIRHVAHDIAVFDEGFAGAGNIRLLEHITAHHLAVDLTRDADQRNTVREGRRDAGDQVGRAGAAGRDRDTDPAGDPGIAARRVGRALLLSDQDCMDICL